MSHDAVEAVMQFSEAREADRLVLLCIAERANAEHQHCFPGIDDISFRARLNKQVTARIVNRLVDAKELVRLYRIGKSPAFIVPHGLTPLEVEANILSAWGMTYGEVVRANNGAHERMGRSRGTKRTLLATLDGSSLSDPSSEDTPTHLATVHDPSSVARTEPSVTINEPSIGEGATSAPLVFKQSIVTDDPKAITVMESATLEERAKTPVPINKPTGPAEMAFGRLAKNSDKNITRLTEAATTWPQTALDASIEFYKVSGIKVDTVKAAKSRIAGGNELYQACGGDLSLIRVAYERLSKSGDVMITDEHSLKKTCNALASQKRTHQPARRVVAVDVEANYED